MTVAFSVAEAASLIGRDVRTVRRWISNGSLVMEAGRIRERDLIAARDAARRRKQARSIDGASPRFGRIIEASGDANRDEILGAIGKAVLQIDNAERVDMGTLTVETQRVGDAIEVRVAAFADMSSST